MIRSAWVLLAGAVMTAYFATLVVIGGWIGGQVRKHACERCPRRWSRLVLRCAGVRLRVSGVDAVDWSRPAILVANHQSWFDVFALLVAVPGKLRFVAKEELGRIPIFGRAWRGCDHMPIDRSDRRRAIASLNQTGEKLREESLIVTMFPEGTRSLDGRLYSFKKGAFVLAIRTGVAILPVGISGSGAVMPKGSFRVRSGEIHIRVGRPIEAGGLGHANRDALAAESRRAVAALAGAAMAGREPDADAGSPRKSEATTEGRG